MKMKPKTLKLKIDSDGYYLEDQYTDEEAETLIEEKIPDGFFRPRWVNNEWVDVDAYKRAELDASLYKEYRKINYPPVEDFLDAIIKGDDAQKQKYIDRCLEVKALFPKGVKPSENLEI